MSFEFLAIGDLHLEKMQNLLPNLNTIDLQLSALQEAVDYAVENGIKYIFQLGDVFENPYPSQDTLTKFIDFLCKNNKVQWRIILGNHDFATTAEDSMNTTNYIASNFNELKHVKIFHKRRHEVIEGFDFVYVPYPFTTKLKSVKNQAICFGHFDIKGVARFNDTKVEHGVTEEKLKKDKWIIGHNHKYQKFKYGVYSGTLYQTNFGETLPCGFLHCSIKRKNGEIVLKHTRQIVSPIYELCNIKVDNIDDLTCIEKDKYYKIFTHKNVVLPSDLTIRYPNILKIVGYSNKKQLKELKNGSISLSKTSVLFNPLKGLKHTLIEVHKLDKKKTKKAIKIAKSIIKEINMG